MGGMGRDAETETEIEQNRTEQNPTLQGNLLPVTGTGEDSADRSGLVTCDDRHDGGLGDKS